MGLISDLRLCVADEGVEAVAEKLGTTKQIIGQIIGTKVIGTALAMERFHEIHSERNRLASMANGSSHDVVNNELSRSDRHEHRQPDYETLNKSWAGKDVMVCFPCYKYTNPATAAMLIAFALDFGRDKIRFEFQLGDAMIYHARNKLAMQFLASDCQWCLWVDDDIIPPVGRPGFTKFFTGLPNDYPVDVLSLHTLERLLSHKKSIVGATYFGRNKNGPPMFAEALNNADARMAARTYTDEVRATEWVATGCLLTHRNVFEDIQKKFPELAPGIREYTYLDENGQTVQKRFEQKEWDFFLPMPGAGEDVAFCRRARAAGHIPHVDLKLHVGHVGFSVYTASNTSNSDNSLFNGATV
jgi:hypothetical protein